MIGFWGIDQSCPFQPWPILWYTNKNDDLNVIYVKNVALKSVLNYCSESLCKVPYQKHLPKVSTIFKIFILLIRFKLILYVVYFV